MPGAPGLLHKLHDAAVLVHEVMTRHPRHRITQTQQRFVPHVVEPSAGLSRGVLALLCEAYTPDTSRPMDGTLVPRQQVRPAEVLDRT